MRCKVENKVCSACKESLPVTRFHRDKSRKDGLNSQCKSCKSVMTKEHNDLKRIMNRWEGTRDYMWWFRKSHHNIHTRCVQCNNDRDMGYIVWYEALGQPTNICRKCIIKIDKTGGHGLEEIISWVFHNYDFTLSMRHQLYEHWKWDRMSDEDLKKLEREYYLK
jgi:hypothetical protein